MSEAAAKAWQDRKPGAAAWGLGHAVVGQNRRAVYAGGHAAMYGRTEPHESLIDFGRADLNGVVLLRKLSPLCVGKTARVCAEAPVDFFHQAVCKNSGTPKHAV